MAESGILGPGDRVELITGEVLDMSPIGSLHAALMRALARWLTDAAGPRAIVAIQDPIRLGDFSEPQPDIALVKPTTHRFRGPLPEGYAEQDVLASEAPLASLALPGEANSVATILPLGRSAGV